MSTVPSELLAGFLVEAQGYVDSLRETLTRNGKMPTGEALQAIYDQVSVLGGAAEMLELGEVSALIAPVQDVLRGCVEVGQDFTEEDGQQLLATLDQIEGHLHAITEPAAQPSEGAPAVTGNLPPEFPPELLEIFALEASDHSQAIQRHLELLGKNPGDQALLSELRRVTHTLKGAAASVGFEVIARLAHLMEDLLERHIDGGSGLTSEALELLFDSADALGGVIGQNQDEETTALLASVDARYAALLGGAYIPPQESEKPPAETAEQAPQLKPGGLLRLPLVSVDLLINRVGEIVINRAVLERHMGAMRTLLSDLDYSARRLGRVAQDIDTQIDIASTTSLASRGAHDQVFDPLELDRYTLLHQHMHELEEVTADTGDINGKLHFLADDLDATLTRERRLTTELQNGLMNTRLVPFHELETRLRQTVRRTAHSLNKQVELNLVGFDTLVDKSILETLADPLMHLLRNAVDHGIEEPEERQAAHKTPAGLVTLRVSRERGRVILNLSDDGAGIDLERVRQQAVRLGLVAEGERPGSERLLDLLFEEGFSLADIVTQTSGRGVGLNIVRRAVNQLQGTVRVETSLGLGTTFTVAVPVTLAITRALFIRCSDQIFAVPLEQISSVLRLPPTAMDEIRAEGVLHYEARAVATYDLGAYVNRRDGAALSPSYGLVIQAESQETIALIDGLAGIHETVVKSLGSHLRRVRGIAGATISGDGRVVLILDLAELAGMESPLSHEVGEPARISIAPPRDSLHVLVVDDSPSVRRVVSSFLERAGWQATPAKDGIDALEKMASVRPDVALVDIEMPRMNGYELLSRIKSDPGLKHIPVVFLTSRSAAKHRKRAEQLQVDGYLMKPYREEQLLEELIRVTQ